MLCQRRHPARLVGHEGDAVTRAEGHAVHAFVGLQVHGRFCGDAVRQCNGGMYRTVGRGMGVYWPVLRLATRKGAAMVQHENGCSARQKSAGSYQN